MRIKITEIEASAEDLRQSKSLSEAVTDAFRKAIIPQVVPVVVRSEVDEEDGAFGSTGE